MRRLMPGVLLAGATLLSGLALAQTRAPESVTVTATKSRRLLDAFARTFAAPAQLTGKIARWESGVCVFIAGQRPELADMAADRVKDLAASVGAPVNSTPGCAANVEVIFTTTPQALLDDVRAHSPDYLGYVEGAAQREKVATMTRPVQAWYMTETIDLDGHKQMDVARRNGAGASMANFTAFAMPGSLGLNREPIILPDATFARVTGNHITDGLRSALYHVLIVADTNKLAGRDFNPVADYIAMLALTQLNSLDACQELPSIVNLLAPGCDQTVEGVTANDLAYLRGLYKMDAGKNLVSQRNEIADRMQEALGR